VVNALTNGGIIFIKKGVYNISRTINISAPVIIEGEGPDWFGTHGTYLKGSNILNFEFPSMMYMPMVRNIQFSVAPSSYAIRLGKNVSDIIIEKVAAHGGIGVLIDGGVNGWIKNCWLETGDYGIRAISGGTGFFIESNRFYNNKYASISLENYALIRMHIRHNTFAKDRQVSINIDATEVHISDNIIEDAGQDALNAYNAIVIKIRGPISIHGNKITGSGTRYGINIIGDSANARVSIKNNIFGVFGTKAINLVSGLIGVYEIKSNIGYVTENRGTATFSGDGITTQFKIAHGLAGTPKVAIVTPASNDAKGTFYVTVDATYIYVNYATAPPASTNNVVLMWYAEM